MLIFLIGLPCCGKTTLGRALAATGRVAFVDLDEEVERRAGASVSEIFARDGEEAFRAMESAALRDIIAAAAERAVVVGCGGGTPCRPENIDAMLAAGEVVWLEAARERLLARLREFRAVRPAFAALGDGEIAAKADSLAAARRPHYSRASSRFDSTRLDTPAEVDDTVRLFISKYL